MLILDAPKSLIQAYRLLHITKGDVHLLPQYLRAIQYILPNGAGIPDLRYTLVPLRAQGPVVQFAFRAEKTQ